MCFYDEGDYDWTVEVCDENYMRSKRRTKCIECRSWIEIDQWCCHIYQQEWEMCQNCEDESSGHYDYDDGYDCEDDHDYGETWEGSTCVSCLKIKAAIYAVEERENCPEHARQPGVEDLDMALTEHESADVYVAESLKLFPEVRNHKLIQRAMEIANR